MHAYVDRPREDPGTTEEGAVRPVAVLSDAVLRDAVQQDEVEAARASMIDGDTAKSLAGIFRALGDPTRLRIISALAERELCVTDLTAALEMAQPAVSHQLRDMLALRLVRARRAGRHIYYRLDDEHVRDLFQLTLAHIRHGERDERD